MHSDGIRLPIYGIYINLDAVFYITACLKRRKTIIPDLKVMLLLGPISAPRSFVF